MNFEEFKKNPNATAINLNLYDAKNSYGEVFFSQAAIDGLNKTIDTFGISQVALKSTENLQQALNLVMLNKIIDGITTEIKDSFKALGNDEVIKIELGDVGKISTQSDIPSQIYGINGLDRFFAVINNQTREKFNAKSNFIEVNARTTVIDAKAKSSLENNLRWDFVSHNDMVKGSFGNIAKLTSNTDLQEFLINTPKYVETPFNFSYRAKKDSVMEFFKPNLGSIFGGNEVLQGVNEKMQFIIDVFKKALASGDQEALRKGLMSEFTYSSLLHLKNTTEKLMQVLQLNPESNILVNSGVGVSVATSQKTLQIENNPILSASKDETVKQFLTPVLNEELEKTVKISSAEATKDWQTNTSFIKRLDKELRLEDISALANNDAIINEIKSNLNEKQKHSITTDLGENIGILKKM